MSLDGTSNSFIPYSLNGINPITGSINTANFVKYSANTSNTDLTGFDLITAGKISAQNFAIPDNNSNDESWISYTVSTMGNLSTIGGLITTDLTNGRSMYFTGGVLGAPNFQFATLGNGGKVVATDANGVMSTTIGVGQLNYITGLTSQAGGIGQTNTWTGTNNFTTLTVSTTATNSLDVVNLSTLTSAVAFINNVNALNFVPYTNALQNLNMMASTITTTGLINAGTVLSTDSKLTGTQYFDYGTGQQWGATVTGSGNYEVQDDTGLMRLRLSKTTGLTVSTLNVTQVPSATPSVALGVNGSGSVVSFAVPNTTGLVPYTGANTTVDLGAQNLFANTARFTGVTSATPSLALGVDVSGNLNSFAVPTTTGLVPYTGANTTVNLGAQNLFANTARFTGVVSGSPSLVLGIDGSGNLNSFTAPPVPINLLPLSNTWTGATNTFNDLIATTLTADRITAPAHTAYDNRQIKPSDIPTASHKFFFGSYNNNTVSPFGDVIGMNGWLDGTGGDCNLLMVKKTGIGMRVFQGTFGSTSPFSTYKDVQMVESNGNVLMNSGNVGIGTGNPQSLLHTYSALGNELRICSGDGYTTRLGLYEDSLGASWGAFVQYTGSNDDLQFGHKRGGTDMVAMVLDVNKKLTLQGELTVAERTLIGFTTPPTTYPFTGNKDLYVNGSIYSAGTNAMVATFGRNTTSAPYNDITFTSNVGGTLLTEIKSHTTGSSVVDATWTYSNTNANPLGSNQGQVRLDADKMTMSLTKGFIVVGLANIHAGTPYAVPNGLMASGSLTIGDVAKNYGNQSSFTTNTAGLLLECLDNTEIAVHDSGNRLTSLMYYSGNLIRLGRDMGFGVSDVVASNNLYANCLIINGGGAGGAGCIYSDVNWGMLFRGRVAGATADFAWFNAAGAELMRLNPASQLILQTADGPGFVQTNGTITVESYIGGTSGWYGTRSNHPLKFYANNSSARMTLNTGGDMTHTAGDNSYMKYGPNAWYSYLVVGASPDRAGVSTAQLVTTNGNIHLDAGNNNEIYYGFYANSRGTPNPHYFYGGNYQFYSVPQNTSEYSHVCVLEGDRLKRSQCLMRQIYRDESISWAGGVNMGYAFYKFNAKCPVKISGKYSGYSTYVGIQQMGMIITHQTTGATYTYTFRTYTNITYAQTTYPFEIILTEGDLGATRLGWFDIYIFNHTGFSTNGDNQLHVCVQLLPTNSF